MTDPACLKARVDEDGDVDLEDFAHLQACFTGQDVEQTNQDCLDAKLDDDGDVDREDFDIFEACISGPDVPAESDRLAP